MSWLTTLTGFAAPFFIVMSPIISYGDQIVSMHRNKTSAGFSLDIPLIMLVASILRIFYWPGARFDASLLVQSMIMVVVQVILLKIALDHRPLPATKGGEGSVPFSGLQESGPFGFQRPYSFWQWRSHKPYWHFLLYLVAGLIVCEILFRTVEPFYDFYSVLIGYLGLSIEATLPIPQLIANSQTRSCKGFRLSVLLSWVGGDAMKVFWFFTSEAEIPMAFKVCGCFQAACDCLLGVQYFIYGAGDNEAILKEHPMEEAHWAREPKPGHSATRSLSPGKRAPAFSEDETE